MMIYLTERNMDTQHSKPTLENLRIRDFSMKECIRATGHTNKNPIDHLSMEPFRTPQKHPNVCKDYKLYTNGFLWKTPSKNICKPPGRVFSGYRSFDPFHLCKTKTTFPHSSAFCAFLRCTTTMRSRVEQEFSAAAPASFHQRNQKSYSRIADCCISVSSSFEQQSHNFRLAFLSCDHQSRCCCIFGSSSLK